MEFGPDDCCTSRSWVPTRSGVRSRYVDGPIIAQYRSDRSGRPGFGEIRCRRLISSPTQVASGQVLRIDPKTEQIVLAQLTPGLDTAPSLTAGSSYSTSPVRSPRRRRRVRRRRCCPARSTGRSTLAVGACLRTRRWNLPYALPPTAPADGRNAVHPRLSPDSCASGIIGSTPGEFIVTLRCGQVARYRPAAGRM